MWYDGSQNLNLNNVGYPSMGNRGNKILDIWTHRRINQSSPEWKIKDLPHRYTLCGLPDRIGTTNATWMWLVFHE